MDDLLELLAQQRGIGQEYTDIWGKTTRTSLENKQAILSAMGYAVTEPDRLTRQLHAEELARWQQILDPVYVRRQQAEYQLVCRLPADAGLKWRWDIQLESGDTINGFIEFADSQKLNIFSHNELLISEYNLIIQQNIPFGYHKLVLLSDKNPQIAATSSFIIAPAHCFHPAVVQQQQKCWGPSVQLYTLRSQRNWGVGDFTDLKTLLRGVAAWGADFVGLNPIHSLYPANPDACSPYSPSSRRWLNIIYIDAEATPEFQANPEIQKALASADEQEKLQQLRAAEWIDYKAVFAFKLRWLRQIFENADLSSRSERGQAFADYIAAGGDSHAGRSGGRDDRGHDAGCHSDAEQQQRLVLSMFGLWVLMGIGFIASTLHLGSPMRAFNSLNRVGASSLSNEIASGAIFFAVGGLGWLLAAMKKLPAGLRSLWLIVTMVLGVVFVWMMIRVYNTIDTVPTWYSVWTPMSFFLTMFIGGPLLGYLLLRVAGVDGWAMRLLPAVSLLALVVSAMVALMQGAELATIHSSIQQASALVPDYGSLMAWRIVLLVAALVFWIAPQLKGYQPALPLLSLAFVLVLAGELIGRGVFYGLHMTVGMAVAS